MSRDDVLGAVRAAAGVAPTEAEQLEMLPTRFDAKIDPFEHGLQIEAVRRDRRGRPPGAKSIATREMLDFIRRTIGDPLLESARMAMHTPATLARELGCEPLEAAQLLEKVRADLRPYFYPKQGPVDADGKAIPGLTVSIGGHGAPVDASGAPVAPWLYLETPREPVEQNQGLKDITPAVSHGGVSHDSEK